MPDAGIRGQRFYYEVGGEGDLVVLLHGALANADLMEAPATGLASGFRAATQPTPSAMATSKRCRRSREISAR